MRQLPQIIGLPADGKVNTFCRSITRARLITVGLVFLGLLSLSLLITVIVQASNRKQNDTTNTITNTSDNNVDGYCLNRGCLSAATHQLRYMDNTVWDDRCTDFYQYACGTWQQTHPIQSFDVERTILGDINDRRDADIERLLNSPVSRLTAKSWEWKVKTYYTECLDDYARVLDSGKALISIIQDRDTIDGWFLFDNGAEGAPQEYLLKNQTIYKQLSHIHGDLGTAVVFDFRIGWDDTNMGTKRLEFIPAGLSMEVNDYLNTDQVSQSRRSLYRVYILEILVLLAQDAGTSDGNLSDRMATVADDIFAIEKELAEHVQFSKLNDDKPVTMTFKEMSDRYSFDFVELMTHEITDPTIVSGITSAYVTSPLYFEKAFELLSKNDNPLIARQIHNYLRWRLVRTYIEDLSYSYIHAHRIFLDQYYGTPLHSTNEIYCTREVIRRFPLAIHRLHTMNSTTHSNTVQTIQTLFDTLKDGFKQYINEQATWMADETTKTFARQKIDALTAAIGYASIASDDARLDDYYELFAIDETSHLANAYGYHRFHRSSIFYSLLNPNQLEHWDLFETRTSRLFEYLAMFNRLFVVASAMHEPLVSAEWPWAMNMGSIGVLLAQKLFASIDGPDGRIHSADGTRIPDWWSASTANAYNTSRQCITNYYVQDLEKLVYNVYGAEVVVKLAGEPFSPTTLRHIGALRFAYTAFKKIDEMKSIKMPGTNLTSDQTFFLAHAQTQCYKRQELLQFIRTQIGFYDEKTALNAALIHMPEFTQTFQCKARDNTCF
ncbi:unnamed protein product [Adineta steineri]|uniref:Uncharacterized protein n=1 Tax=Adineta steineri TaxID=433720 RepID=A0A818IG00_9BILA|nr:unnamed protein product [Adineta steineri]CAF3520621.1 unnamed protein product [Adineta steineri]